jgi:signal transduction histidine kinase
VHDHEGGETWDIACAVAAPGVSGAGSLLVVARNVTRLVLLQESLRRSETMAEMGRLVAGVAHEVRNPLFAISAILDAWTARGASANIEQYQTTLRREIERMRGLMGELLEYGRPYNQELRLGDVAAAATDALASCSALAESRHVTVRYGVSKALIRMDRARLSRVFLNVLENAIQHAPEHTDVVIASCEEGRAFVDITVRDGGPGFEPDSLHRLFTPFFSRRPGGIGLGLAIVQRIADEHQGRVRAENHPEGGALITIRLPLASPLDAVRT